MGTTDLMAKGFSLVEVMVSGFVLTIAAVALLQGFGFVYRSYAFAQDHWETSVDLWRRVEESRAAPATDAEPLQILPRARPLYRTVLFDSHRRWEVLRAQK